MKLIKHYDFINMTELDKDFNIVVGDKWHNNEQQIYVDDKENLYLDNGLNIKATYKNNVIRSARISTKNNFMFRYGKIEITAKLPKGKGTWPALWMMPQQNTYGHWPKSGEIDMMEHVGNHLDELVLCLHTEKYNHTKDTEYYFKKHIKGLSDDFQVFGLEWNEDSIKYTLNGEEMVTYHKGENGKVSSHEGWPFDQPFYLVMNLAIGGWFGGEIDFDSLPQVFQIKEIKIYQ